MHNSTTYRVDNNLAVVSLEYISIFIKICRTKRRPRAIFISHTLTFIFAQETPLIFNDVVHRLTEKPT